MDDRTDIASRDAASRRGGRKARPLVLGTLAFAGIAALNHASARGLPHQAASLGCIPLTVMWFYAMDGLSDPARPSRISTIAHAAACAGFVGWLLADAAT